MLEDGDVLLTWALASLPEQGVAGEAERLPDHRKRYLDYEGAISGGRGDVRRYDRGECTFLETSDENIRVELQGERLRGTILLTRCPSDEEEKSEAQRWRVCFSPAKGRS